MLKLFQIMLFFQIPMIPIRIFQSIHQEDIRIGNTSSRILQKNRHQTTKDSSQAYTNIEDPIHQEEEEEEDANDIQSKSSKPVDTFNAVNVKDD